MVISKLMEVISLRWEAVSLPVGIMFLYLFWKYVNNVSSYCCVDELYFYNRLCVKSYLLAKRGRGGVAVNVNC